MRYDYQINTFEMMPLLKDTRVVNIDEMSVEVKNSLSAVLKNKATQITLGVTEWNDPTHS